MTVKELIKELEKFPENYKVSISHNYDYNGIFPVIGVEPIPNNNQNLYPLESVLIIT